MLGAQGTSAERILRCAMEGASPLGKEGWVRTFHLRGAAPGGQAASEAAAHFTHWSHLHPGVEPRLG